jgi:hypothetical protein
VIGDRGWGSGVSGEEAGEQRAQYKAEEAADRTAAADQQ